MVKQHLATLFERDLASGEIISSGKLPTFRQLATRYGSSPATIKRLVDCYEQRGVLRTLRGSGTYVIGWREGCHRVQRKQIGFVMLNDQLARELDRLKEEYLKSGWIFTVYNASSDQQNPELEKDFLVSVSQQEFEAIILEASPLQPVNQELFTQLRSQGIKIAHLSPYQKDMRREACFMPDFYAAGQVAAARLALAGYRRIVFFSEGLHAPFVDLGRSGLKMMCDQLELGFEDVWDETPDYFARRLASEGGRPAVFCVNSFQGCELMEARNRLRLDFGIVALMESLLPASYPISFFDYPYERIVRDALAYAMDADQDPLTPVLSQYEPVLVNRGSF